MTRRAITAATLLALSVVPPAYGADKPTPSPSGSARSVAPKSSPAPDLYATQMRTYVQVMRVRTAQIDAINKAFSAAVKQAQRDYKAARSLAKTAEAKNQAEASRRAAIAAATAARQKAIDDLGPMPVKPEPPSTSSAAPTPSA